MKSSWYKDKMREPSFTYVLFKLKLYLITILLEEDFHRNSQANISCKFYFYYSY